MLRCFVFTIEWKARAVVGECRALSSVKSKEIWGYSIKLQVIGGTYDVMTRDKAIFDSVGEGQEVDAVGGFETYNGQLKMLLKAVQGGGAK
jgi:hypothetical protein